jgi:hypothetical protein
MNKQLKIGIILLVVCTTVAIASTAMTINLFPHWSVYANGAVSGIWAGLAATFVLPKLR